MSGTDRREGARTEKREEPRFGDTFAWLLAAATVVGPILLVLVASVALAYGVIHLLFLR